MKYIRFRWPCGLMLAQRVGGSEIFISHPGGHSCPGLMLVYAIV